jgi:hypothetical protein
MHDRRAGTICWHLILTTSTVTCACIVGICTSINNALVRSSRPFMVIRTAPTAAYNVSITAGIYDRRNRVLGSVCTAAILSRSCPLWVKSGHRGVSNQCPLYPQERTSPTAAWRPLSAKIVQIHLASGSGRSWNRTARGRLAVPPSRWNIVLVP